MPFFVGYFLSLMRPNSNLMWHDVFVTAPLFQHIDFNAWFRSFRWTLVFFGWFSDVLILWRGVNPDLLFAATLLLIWYSFILRIWLPSASSIQSNSSQVLPQIGIPINTSQLALLVLYDVRLVLNRRGRTWLTTTRAHLPTAHSSQNVSSASAYNLSKVH